jgi:hypothetical protein
MGYFSRSLIQNQFSHAENRAAFSFLLAVLAVCMFIALQGFAAYNAVKIVFVHNFFFPCMFIHPFRDLRMLVIAQLVGIPEIVSTRRF